MASGRIALSISFLVLLICLPGLVLAEQQEVTADPAVSAEKVGRLTYYQGGLLSVSVKAPTTKTMTIIVLNESTLTFIPSDSGFRAASVIITYPGGVETKNLTQEEEKFQLNPGEEARLDFNITGGNGQIAQMLIRPTPVQPVFQLKYESDTLRPTIAPDEQKLPVILPSAPFLLVLVGGIVGVLLLILIEWAAAVYKAGQRVPLPPGSVWRGATGCFFVVVAMLLAPFTKDAFLLELDIKSFGGGVLIGLAMDAIADKIIKLFVRPGN